LDVSAARVLLMQLELLEIRRFGVLSHKRGRYCRLSPSNRKWRGRRLTTAERTVRLEPMARRARSSLMAFANYWCHS